MTKYLSILPKRTFPVLIALIFTIFEAAALFVHAPAARADIGFNPGRIIDDAVFTNWSSMSASDIQNFLNSEDPSCDTNGSQTLGYYYNSSTGQVSFSGFSGGSYVTNTRATFGQQYASWYNAHPYTGYITNESLAPYTCLTDYIENPSSGQTNLQNPSASIPGGESAAQIIYNAGQQYQINPQVLLVTLQKEQGLVTDDWPWLYEYQEATGFNCPDSGTCGGYAGFYQQVNAAAEQFRNYLNNPNSFNYIVGNNTIDYNSPSYGCNASSTVDIQNIATAALYDYTPYQPDSNVLAATNPPGSSNGPGGSVSDICASYGNIHFWWYFNTWFGSTIQSSLPGCPPATNTTLTCVWDMQTPGSNPSEYLTSDIPTRDELYSADNYQYIGVAFYGNVAEMPGNIPVYRASTTGGGSFLTTNVTEYNALVAGGYTGDGVDFYADPPGSNDGFPVYRLYNPSTGQHYWTGSAQEQQTLLQSGWNSEGLAFNSIDTIRQETPPPPGDDLVYRFYIPQSYSHFWTTDLGERDSMIAAGYDYEGVAWYSSTNTSDTPVYRLYAPSIMQHLYTTDMNEVNTLVASGGWNDEGIDQYVATAPNSAPVYRLYAPSLGVHLFTEDSNERARLLGSGGWNDEGIAWYQP